MTTLRAQFLSLVTLLLLLLLVIKVEGDSIPKPKQVCESATTVSSSTKVEEDVDQRPSGCSTRPWICNQGEFPLRSICCGNRCVDVTTDVNNCGLCGIRCRFNWQCCNRLCINTNVNPLNCGRCGRACPFGRLCLFGLCAFEQALPPLLPPGLPEPNPPQPLNHQPQYPKQPPPLME